MSVMLSAPPTEVPSQPTCLQAEIAPTCPNVHPMAANHLVCYDLLVKSFLSNIWRCLLQTNRWPPQDRTNDMPRDSSIPLSPFEKKAEYECNLKNLEKETAMIQLESRRNRRKIPRPGCYPVGFSEYTMGSVPCTLVLSELRSDLSKCSVVPPSSSIYFDEAMSSEAVQPQSRGIKQARQPAQSPIERFSLRRKTPNGQLLCPRSAAEEARQLSEVLRKSLMDCNAGRSTCAREGSSDRGFSAACSAADASEAHRKNASAATILCSLN